MHSAPAQHFTCCLPVQAQLFRQPTAACFTLCPKCSRRQDRAKIMLSHLAEMGGAQVTLLLQEVREGPGCSQERSPGICASAGSVSAGGVNLSKR
jgi:hypothetical protein